MIPFGLSIILVQIRNSIRNQIQRLIADIDNRIYGIIKRV